MTKAMTITIMILIMMMMMMMMMMLMLMLMMMKMASVRKINGNDGSEDSIKSDQNGYDSTKDLGEH